MAVDNLNTLTEKLNTPKVDLFTDCWFDSAKNSIVCPNDSTFDFFIPSQDNTTSGGDNGDDFDSSGLFPYPLYVNIICCIISAFICFVNAIGNFVVLLAFCLESSLRQPANFFIASLAAADMIVGSFLQPTFTIYSLYGEWPFSSLFCKTWVTADWGICLVAEYAILLITVDRFLSVKMPVKYFTWRTKGKVQFIIFLNWSIPILIFGTVTFGIYQLKQSPRGRQICQINFLEDRKSLLIALFLYFWMGLCSNCSLYGIIYKTALDLNKRAIVKERRFKALLEQSSHHSKVIQEPVSPKSQSSKTTTSTSLRSKSSRKRDVNFSNKRGNICNFREVPAAELINLPDACRLPIDTYIGNRRLPTSMDTSCEKVREYGKPHEQNHFRRHSIRCVKDNGLEFASSINSVGKRGNSTHAEYVVNQKPQSFVAESKLIYPLFRRQITKKSTVQNKNYVQEFPRETAAAIASEYPDFCDVNICDGNSETYGTVTTDSKDTHERIEQKGQHLRKNSRLSGYQITDKSNNAGSSMYSQPLDNIKPNSGYKTAGSVTSKGNVSSQSGSTARTELRKSLRVDERPNYHELAKTASGVDMKSSTRVDRSPEPSHPPVIVLNLKSESNLFDLHQENKIPAEDDTTRKHDEMLAAARTHKAFRTISFILGVFVVCKLPHHIVLPLKTLCDNCTPESLYLITYWMCYLNSTVNPFLYAYVNPNFKKAFTRILQLDLRNR